MNGSGQDEGSRVDDDEELDPLIVQEENAAAAEAARIGGNVRPLSDDPAMEPLYEAGEGEQEGWEEAERELVENATHGEGRGDPELDAFSPERETDLSTAAYGEADEFTSTERDEDATGPETIPDDG
jgi:hypothetical protein